jgi:hypothetical protein
VASTAMPWIGSATANDGSESGKLRANPSGGAGVSRAEPRPAGGT